MKDNKKPTLRVDALRKLANGMSIETEQILRTAVSYLPSTDSALDDIPVVCMSCSVML